MGQPIFGIGHHRLFQSRSGRRIILLLQAGPSEKGQRLGVVRVEICGRAQVGLSAGEIFFLKIQIPQQKVQFRAGGR